VSVFKYIFKINFAALPGKGLTDVLSLRMSLQLRSEWACISEQRPFIVHRNGAANNGSYVYNFKTQNIYRNPQSLKIIRINWVQKHWHCYLHALETYVLESVLFCMKILYDFTYFQEQFSLGRQPYLVHVPTSSCRISEFGERDCL